MSSLKQTPTIPQPKYVISPDQIKGTYRNVFEAIDQFNQRCESITQQIRLNFYSAIREVMKTYFKLVNAGKVAYGAPMELSTALLAKFARSKRHAAINYRRRMIELGFISQAERKTPDTDKPQFSKFGQKQHFNTLWNVNLNAFEELLKKQDNEAVESAQEPNNNAPASSNPTNPVVIHNSSPQSTNAPQNGLNALSILFYKMLIINIFKKSIVDKINTIISVKGFTSKIYYYNDVDMWITLLFALNAQKTDRNLLLESVFGNRQARWGEN